MYNATVFEIRSGQRLGCFVAEVDKDGKMLRSNALQCTGREGTIEYDGILRKSMEGSELEIVVDSCDGYRNCLSTLNLPPAYKISSESRADFGKILRSAHIITLQRMRRAILDPEKQKMLDEEIKTRTK